jgi:hypothetical protein
MQEKPIQIQGAFIEDSAKIGQPVHYVLKVLHSKNQELFFPGNNTKIGHFEPIKKEYFSTQTSEKGSLDSAIYTFKFFDIADFQILSLPIYLINAADCTQIYPKADTIFIKRLVPHPELINLNTLIGKVEVPLLKPKTDIKNVFIGGIEILVVTGIIYWVFGANISRTYRYYLLWRKNIEFKRAFQRQSRSISQDPKGIRRLENAILVWKIYIEKLTKTPFSTFTTTEMVDNLKDKRLAKALKAIDSAIYGRNFSEKTMESVNLMVEIASAAYQTERRKIKLERKKK